MFGDLWYEWGEEVFSGGRGMREIETVNFTHDAMIDALIAQPQMTHKQLAEKFGYTAQWAAIIWGSEAFQGRLRERCTEIVDPALRATVEDRFRGVMLRSCLLYTSDAADE